MFDYIEISNDAQNILINSQKQFLKIKTSTFIKILSCTEF